MACTAIIGFDSGFAWGELDWTNGPPGTSVDVRLVSEATIVHTAGGRSMKIAPGANLSFGPTPCYSYPAGGTSLGGSSRSLFKSFRFYLRVDSLPTAVTRSGLGAASLWTIGLWVPGGTTGFLLGFNPNATLSLEKYNPSTANTVRATSTNAWPVGDGQFHRVELDFGWSAGAGMRVYVDGALWASDATDTVPAFANFTLGGGLIVTGTPLMYLDDLVCYDSSLGGPLAADYNVKLLTPVSDNATVGWTAGAGATTNLFNAVDNIPPAGLADGSATNTSQIRHAAKSATDNYDANIQSYSAAGLTASDTINAVMGWVRQGTTAPGNSVDGAVVIVSNPSGQTENSFDFGDAVTTAFTDGDASNNYVPAWGPVTENPSVVLATQPVLRVGKRTADKTAVDVDFMGINVMYTPAVAAGGGPWFGVFQVN